MLQVIYSIMINVFRWFLLQDLHALDEEFLLSLLNVSEDLFLELGGNNAIIVPENADMKMLVPAVVFGAIREQPDNAALPHED